MNVKIRKMYPSGWKRVEIKSKKYPKIYSSNLKLAIMRGDFFIEIYIRLYGIELFLNNTFSECVSYIKITWKENLLCVAICQQYCYILCVKNDFLHIFSIIFLRNVSKIASINRIIAVRISKQMWKQKSNIPIKRS